MTSPPRKILLAVTGSIAAYRACDIAYELKRRGHDVTCLLTKEAAHFITPLSLENFSGHRVYSDLFSESYERNPIHTVLAQEADLILIAPATANLLAKLAVGLLDDLVTCTLYATTAPILVCPAMNDKMLQHPVVQANMEKLRSLGYQFVDPIVGPLVCGAEAEGHLAETTTIVESAERLLKEGAGRVRR